MSDQVHVLISGLLMEEVPASTRGSVVISRHDYREYLHHLEEIAEWEDFIRELRDASSRQLRLDSNAQDAPCQRSAG